MDPIFYTSFGQLLAAGRIFGDFHDLPLVPFHRYIFDGWLHDANAYPSKLLQLRISPAGCTSEAPRWDASPVGAGPAPIPKILNVSDIIISISNILMFPKYYHIYFYANSNFECYIYKIVLDKQNWHLYPVIEVKVGVDQSKGTR
jgi:hypothetical protein